MFIDTLKLDFFICWSIPGKYPVEAVSIMAKIALEAEAALFNISRFNELCQLTTKPTDTIHTTAIAAVHASFQQHAAAIVTLTATGRYVSYSL